MTRLPVVPRARRVTPRAGARTGCRREAWPEDQGLAASVPGWTTVLYQSRYLSDGGRLFFDSSDALVPQDTNNTEDVYEWEPAIGVGGTESPAGDTCTPSTPGYEPASGGCVGLISNGRSPEPSGFLDASENGEDVFFLTTANLSKRDVDTAYDVYDARVHGSEPAEPQPEVCVGDSCQPSVAAPEDPAQVFQGAGNFPAPLAPPTKKVTKKTVKCEKGKTRNEHKKCVSKPRRKSKARKASHARKASR
jgi:hypothetical protein